MQKRSRLLIGLTVFLTIILAGCFQGEQSLDNEEMDPPQDAEAGDGMDENAAEEANTEENENTENQEDQENQDQGNAASDPVDRQLYLLDSNGMVASQTLQLPQPESNEVAKQALEYLVKDGPVSSLLPNGFQAVLPAGTQILELNLKDSGTMIVDVSDEFKNYQAENELKILQAMTFTVTQFDSVDNLKLRINGKPQNTMPVDGTPIGEGYSRVNGINLVQSGADLLESKPVTLYYPSAQGDNQYFVPVTQHINVEESGLYGSMVQTLMEGPDADTNLQHVFNNSAELTTDPSLNEGVLEVVFNQSVLQESDNAVISNEVMETLVRTLTQDEEVEAVEVKVEDVETLFNENGEPYTEPVTTQSFFSTEKL
ncbi:GerMN domain-containing protein [Lentibacillus amyloliquefaciens]|uniref:Spore gernimation protein n=1 Tax=Lentibacillus amyloliquefaciens TaxID=1472767 RepID=A0A0U4DSB4_9BACI|nr:GerMN domain-containing protein [Lentibacillus amyloliquefaciens]ALX48232.1 spore gernimation protein [Lentibacillus amyloliquefaciens]